jgi:L-seryl-tRNA(Ser) seleniumtransferase
MRANSLFRALRGDKLTYAALEATLLAYVKGNHDAIPALLMMRLSKEEIGKRAESLARDLRLPGLRVEIIDGESVIGGGAAPSATLPTRLLALSHADLSADAVAARLRAASPPVIARVEEGKVLLDLRTVSRGEDSVLISAIGTIEAELRMKNEE